jgi:hypothetical protein
LGEYIRESRLQRGEIIFWIVISTLPNRDLALEPGLLIVPHRAVFGITPVDVLILHDDPLRIASTDDDRPDATGDVADYALYPTKNATQQPLPGSANLLDQNQRKG